MVPLFLCAMQTTSPPTTLSNTSAENRRLNIRQALWWACFLGSSWTWVVGMFLPVLLWRDFGLVGWIVFAIPNVVGAAAMAFVLPNALASQRLVRQHKEAALWFSKITLCFQVFAGIWIIYQLLGVGGIIGGIAVALWTWALCIRNTRTMLTGTAVVTAISFGLLIYWLSAHFNGLPTVAPQLTTTDLILFAPASFLGFLLCPYLDLTFHRARQATNPNTGKVAFVLGFGVVFAVMILFSLLYTQQLLTYRTGAIVIGLQFLFQAGLTAGLHINEIAARRSNRRWLLPCAVALILIAGLLGAWALTQNLNLLHATVGETIYRCFLIFYGLVFPAYVWLVMIPTRKITAVHQRKIVWAIATIICLPMAFLFIVLSWSWWILGVLVVLVIAKAALECTPKPACEPNP